MKKIVFIFFLMSLIVELYPQCKSKNYKYTPFKENNLWGLKESQTNNVTVSPRYIDLICYNDSLLIVLNESKNSFFKPIDCLMINYKGDTLVSSGTGLVHLSFDVKHQGKFLLNEVYVVNGRKELYTYFISPNRECIPYDYYPCPPSVEMSNDSIPLYLSIIQKAEEFKDKGHYDKAVEQIIYTLEIEPDNPFTYYWGAKYFLENLSPFQRQQLFYFYNVNNDTIELWLKKALFLETNDSYKLKIFNQMNLYNSIYNPSITANRKIYNDARKIASFYSSKGFTILFGLEFTNNGAFEVGFGISTIQKNKEYSFSKNNNFSFITIGGSYIYFPKSDLRGFKLNLFSFYAPVRFGFSPIFYTNKENNLNHLIFAIRPELGYSYQNILLYYGFNIYKRNESFSEFSKHIVGIRYIFQIFPTYRDFE